MLYDRDLYINENNPFLFNTDIIEYDMKEAGLSLIKEFKLLDNKLIERISKEDKKIRNILIGNIQKDNKELVKELKEAFIYARKLFFEANNIDNNDIISIKKDAIFVSKICKIQKFGDNINFRPKNFYTSYINLGKKLELYYNIEKLDVKGLSDTNYNKHKDYIINFLKIFISIIESGDIVKSIKYLRNFIDEYKWKKLDIGYYRSFDNKSIYKKIDNDMEFDRCFNIDELDITYNFYILLKLYKVIL